MAPQKASQPLSQENRTRWDALVEQADKQRLDFYLDDERIAGRVEATTDAVERDVTWAIEKAINSNWIIPLGARPIGYIIALETMRDQEARKVGPWAPDA